jgi:DNA replication factor GINS|tara:strand:+ start:537 stop:938 length:402 start_codon:yes stop_codon:yes gene_type:complete
MSQPNPINISFLQTFILRESENEAIQELKPNFYESLSKFIGDLKKEEYDGVEEKIKNTLLNMVTDIASLLLKLRLEKAILVNSNQSMLLDEEKYILDSRNEMEERKSIILSGILSGKTKLLEPITKNQKPQDD